MKELIYPSTYHAMKAGPCRVGACKHDGKCWLCEEYGTLRRYAARDTDKIHELRAIVNELEDEKHISDAIIKSLRDKKLEMAGEIAAKDAEIKNLRSALNAQMKEISAECEKLRTLICEFGAVRISDKEFLKSETISQPDRGERSNAETTEAIDPTHSAVRKG